MTKARTLIKCVLDRFYIVHHDKQTFENELVDEIGFARVRAFTETKRQVIEALDHRLDMLKRGVEFLSADTTPLSHADHLSKIDELETFRLYVKGMVIKVEE